MTSWRQEKREVERIERLPLDRAQGARRGRRRCRSSTCASEPSGQAGHIPGSVFAPWHDIDEVPEGLDVERPVAVVCGSGQRAAVGASLIQRLGAERVIHVIEGGVPKWKRLGHPIESDSD